MRSEERPSKSGGNDAAGVARRRPSTHHRHPPKQIKTFSTHVSLLHGALVRHGGPVEARRGCRGAQERDGEGDEDGEAHVDVEIRKNVTDVEKRPVFLVLDSRVLRQKNEPNSMSLVTV